MRIFIPRWVLRLVVDVLMVAALIYWWRLPFWIVAARVDGRLP